MVLENKTHNNKMHISCKVIVKEYANFILELLIIHDIFSYEGIYLKTFDKKFWI